MLVPLFLTAGVIYAVLLGFMVVGEWEFMTRRAPMPARRPLCSCRSTGRQPSWTRTAVMRCARCLREYAEHVVQGWQRFANGERNRQAGHDANALLSVIGELKFETKAAFTRLGRL